MRRFLFSLFSSGARPSRTLDRRVRLTAEECEPRVLLAGNVSERVPLDGVFDPPPAPGHFASLNVTDASGDDSPVTVFKNGALRVNYQIALNGPWMPVTSPLDRVIIEAWRDSTKVADLGSFTPLVVADGLVNLADTPSLAAGGYFFRATAYFKNGSAATAESALPLSVKAGEVRNGGVNADTFFAGSLTGNAIVIHGNGGTDTLDLGIHRDDIYSINGRPLNAFTPTGGGQAIFQGLVDAGEAVRRAVALSRAPPWRPWRFRRRPSAWPSGRPWTSTCRATRAAWRFIATKPDGRGY